MPHVTLTGEVTGEYVVRDRRDDGTLVLGPSPASTPACDLTGCG